MVHTARGIGRVYRLLELGLQPLPLNLGVLGLLHLRVRRSKRFVLALQLRKRAESVWLSSPFSVPRSTEPAGAEYAAPPVLQAPTGP